MHARSARPRRPRDARSLLPPGWSCDLLLGLFGGGFVCSHGAGPEPVELCAEFGETGWIDRVDAAIARLPVDHQPGFLERLEMLRDGRPADRQSKGEIADRGRALGQALEDGPPGGIAEDGPPRKLVSCHAP